MMKNKKFDCVEMKWQIQKQLQNKYAKIDDAEAHKLQMEIVLRNPILGEFAKKIKKTTTHCQAL